MTIPNIATDPLGYQEWRDSIILYPINTLFKCEVTRKGHNQSGLLKAGQHIKIIDIHNSYMGRSSKNADKTYVFILTNEHGREFKRKYAWGVEGVARLLDAGELILVR